MSQNSANLQTFTFLKDEEQEFEYNSKLTYSEFDEIKYDRPEIKFSLNNLMNILKELFNNLDIYINVDSIIKSNVPHKFKILIDIYKVFNEIKNKEPNRLKNFEINIVAGKIDNDDQYDNIIIFMKLNDNENDCENYFYVEEKIFEKIKGMDLVVFPVF